MCDMTLQKCFIQKDVIKLRASLLRLLAQFFIIRQVKFVLVAAFRNKFRSFVNCSLFVRVYDVKFFGNA